MARHTRRPTRMTSCTGKRKLTRADAQRSAGWWRRVRQARLMSAYKCRFCTLPDGSHAWHVGNRRPR